MKENTQWEPINLIEAEKIEKERKSLTYWQDVWRRLRENVLAMIGLVMIIVLTLLAVVGPMISDTKYSDQNLALSNLPPRLELVQISDEDYVFVHQEYKLVQVTAKGEVIGVPELKQDNTVERYKIYDVNGKEVKLDYGTTKKKTKKSKKAVVSEASQAPAEQAKYKLLVEGKEIDLTNTIKVFNKTNRLGTDHLGRDVWIRVLFGARISLTVGLVASMVNLIVGVLYGGISGYEGGKVDNIMMRIVDLINSIPLLLIVILMMVLIEPGIKTIILTIGLVYWVSMARLVRGQVLSLKEQEFILAARALGVSKARIIIKHLLPNAIGPIIVTLTMSIPSAIFTESFLSFIGLGVSAPQASWGTLANDALGGIRSYPYQLIVPSIAIAITMFAFNFLGDGLRDALDPRLRK
ncbi:MAG: ABC transporter permease [Cellulosilyticaceae bacterium]